MQAHVLGFLWDFTGGYGKHVTLDDLAHQLQSLRNKEFEFGGYQRLIYTSSHDDYITGLLLTAKDHKRFCELRRKGTTLKINVREAEQGSSLIDFNFFLIDKKHARGLYQHYHNSCNARVFTRLCGQQFDKVAVDKISREIVAKGGTKACPEEEQEAMREKYEGDVICNLHVRKEKFAEIVKQMQKISSCDFTLATIEPEKEKWFRILTGVSNIVRHHVSFKRHATVSERAKAVIELVNSGEANDASVFGVDEDGLDRVISIANNPDSFGHWEFDDLAAGMTFEPENFAKCKFIKTLVALAEKHRDFLQTQVK